MGRENAVEGRAIRVLSEEESVVRRLSDRLVAAQRPLRILQAIRWDETIERAFFARGCSAQPPVTRDYYANRPLPFDPAQKADELQALERDIRRQLGPLHAAGQIMIRMCREYHDVAQMLAQRGTVEFAAISQRLYGSTRGQKFDAATELADICCLPTGQLSAAATYQKQVPKATLDAASAARILAERLALFFQDASLVRVKLSDRIAADAAAGPDYIKLRRAARFTLDDLHLLEVHEGWVHLATGLNGRHQRVCTFLSHGPPSTTITQEGLAVLTEMLALATHPGRIRRLLLRTEGVALAEAGGGFLDVFRFFEKAGYDPRESYRSAMRIFRGSLPAGCGPFTKDLSYVTGCMQICRRLRSAIGAMEQMPLLFCGKTSLADIDRLSELAQQGLIDPPCYLAPPFADTHAAAERIRVRRAA